MLTINRERKRLYFLTALFVATLIVCGLGLVMIILAATKEINQVALQASSKIATSVIADKNRHLGRIIIDFTWWDEAVENVAVKFSPEWADANYGEYFYTQENISRTLLIDGDGKLLYISINGERHDPANYTSLATELSGFVARARVDSNTPPHAVHDYVAVSGEIFILVGSALVRTDNTYPGMEENRAPVTLIIMKAIDEDFLLQLNDDYGLKGIKLDNTTPVQNERLLFMPLNNLQGITVGVLSWSVDLPGNRLLNTLMQSVGLLILLLTIIGVFFVQNVKKSNLALLQQNARLTALTAEIEKANASLAQLSYVDGLTGVFNRRKFDERLPREWSRNKRNHHPLGLIFIDIDYFKNYNDMYGHPAGDRCLSTVANTIQETLKRPTDLVARYGGEEFVCLLPNTDTEGTRCIMEKIRLAVEGLEISHNGSLCSNKITISLGGVSMVPAKDTQETALLQQADSNLYEAKGAGRNCSII